MYKITAGVLLILLTTALTESRLARTKSETDENPDKLIETTDLPDHNEPSSKEQESKTTEEKTATSTTTETNIKIEQRLIDTNNKYSLLGKTSNDLAESSEAKKAVKEEQPYEEEDTGPVPCTCGVFMSGQFKKGSKEQPKGLPVMTQETDTPFMNNAMGNRQCTNKCLELVVKHLPKSGDMVCAMSDREDVYKERAYLFIKNYSQKWIKTNMSAGREFCCKDYTPYKCP